MKLITCRCCGLRFTRKAYQDHLHPEGYQHDPLGTGSHYVDADGVSHPVRNAEVNSGTAPGIGAERY
jgi:hypothetical protein